MKNQTVHVLALLMSVSTAAVAGFVDEQNKHAINGASAVNSGSGTVEVDGAKANGMIHGFGKSVPLHEALSHIVPKTYAIKYGGGINEGILVNWQGGRDWISAMSGAVAAIPGMRVSVDHASKVVVIKMLPVTGNVGEEGGEVREWSIRLSDGLLSNAVKRWGQEGGYQAIWDAPKDFPVAAEAVFVGKFRDAINGIVESLAASDAPVKALFYSNRVVRIIRFDGQTTDLLR